MSTPTKFEIIKCVCYSAKEWWNYAIQSTLHPIQDRNRRLAKDYMLSHARDAKNYVDAYTEKLRIGEYYMERLQKVSMVTSQLRIWNFMRKKMLWKKKRFDTRLLSQVYRVGEQMAEDARVCMCRSVRQTFHSMRSLYTQQ